METKRYEDSDFTAEPAEEMAPGTAESAEEQISETQNPENPDAPDFSQGGESTAGDGADTGDAADSADTPPPADTRPGDADGDTGSRPEGSGDSDSGDEGGDEGDADGEGDPSGSDGKEDSSPKPDNQDNPVGKEFGERFLTSGGTASLSAEVLAGRREALAVSLLSMALELLTGRMPGKEFIPLMDAVLAREAIVKARAEGEIAGRNAVIEEQLVAPPVGAPDLNGAPIARSRRQAASIFDLADLAR